MTKTHLKSLTYDQKVSENSTKWPKITSKCKSNAKTPTNGKKMIKNPLKTGQNGQKRPKNHLKVPVSPYITEK